MPQDEAPRVPPAQPVPQVPAKQTEIPSQAADSAVRALAASIQQALEKWRKEVAAIPAPSTGGKSLASDPEWVSSLEGLYSLLGMLEKMRDPLAATFKQVLRSWEAQVSRHAILAHKTKTGPCGPVEVFSPRDVT